MEAQEQVDKLCEGNEILFEPDLRSHAVFVDVLPEIDNDELISVTFKVGNSEGLEAVQGKLWASYKKEKGKKSPEVFKKDIVEIIEQLKVPKVEEGPAIGSSEFNRVLKRVFLRVDSEGQDRKAQTTGNCALKVFLKVLLYQMCEESGCPTAYHEITMMFCNVLRLFFQKDQVVLARLSAKESKLNSKLEKHVTDKTLERVSKLKQYTKCS